MRSDKYRTHDKSEVIGKDEGYRRLAASIIIQAVDDYKIFGGEEIVFKQGEWFVKSPIKFFLKGDWCKMIFETITNYPIEYLTERVL